MVITRCLGVSFFTLLNSFTETERTVASGLMFDGNTIHYIQDKKRLLIITQVGNRNTSKNNPIKPKYI